MHFQVAQERNPTLGDAVSLPFRRAGEEKSQTDGRKESLNENETTVAAYGWSSRI